MRHSIRLAWVAGFLVASAAPLHAQTELQRAAEIINRRQTAPPTPARVEPPRVETAPRTVVVPQREVVVVQRVRARDGWWRNPGYQMITVYYDGGRFYRRAFDRRPMRKVVVYRRGAHYYIDEGHWRREHRLHYGRDYRWNDDDKRHGDKWKDDDKWRSDDKRKDDDRWRDDDRRKHDHDRDEQKGNNGRHLGHDKDKHKDRDKDKHKD
jgi:hypothetical protein